MMNGFNEFILKEEELTTENCNLTQVQINTVKEEANRKIVEMEKERGINVKRSTVTYVIDSCYTDSVGVSAKYKNGSVLFSVETNK